MTLYLVSVDDVPDDMALSSIEALFVDDLSGVWSSQDVDRLVQDVNPDFNSILRWSKQNNQAFAPKKFQLMNFEI